ncbi:group III truncated hemoglobin [Flavobacterium ardleyense]|uniref:group III truncated hemoglobin n=1 Tax=Flavobacterium ardleyense TaxID=2038737 RepID=UPI00298D466A|nr:group III truncated hemoglobin [Flavobacterium ardleyense]
MKNDIQNLVDIQLLVDTFYNKIREDHTLKDIFNNKIQDRWPEHLTKMYSFWQTVLLEEHTYYGSPFVPHAKLPIDLEHFDQWLLLFTKTVDDLFEGEKAEKAKWQGNRMAQMFHSKITYYNNNTSVKII